MMNELCESLASRTVVGVGKVLTWNIQCFFRRSRRICNLLWEINWVHERMDTWITICCQRDEEYCPQPLSKSPINPPTRQNGTPERHRNPEANTWGECSTNVQPRSTAPHSTNRTPLPRQLQQLLLCHAGGGRPVPKVVLIVIVRVVVRGHRSAATGPSWGGARCMPPTAAWPWHSWGLWDRRGSPAGTGPGWGWTRRGKIKPARTTIGKNMQRIMHYYCINTVLCKIVYDQEIFDFCEKFCTWHPFPISYFFQPIFSAHSSKIRTVTI